MSENIVYLENLPVTANSSDVIEALQHFGRVKRIKFFSTKFTPKGYQDPIDFRTDIAMVEFYNSEDRNRCAKSLSPIIIQTYVVQVWTDPKIILTQFTLTLFVYFSQIYVTEDTIFESLIKQKCDPLSVTILSGIEYNKPGFGIVMFSSPQDKARSLSIQLPNLTFVDFPIDIFQDFKFTDEGTIPEIEVIPEFSPSILLDENYYDYELVFQDETFPINYIIASCYSDVIRDSDGNRFTSSVKLHGPYEIIAEALMGNEIPINAGNAVFLLVCAIELKMDELIQAARSLINNLENEEFIFAMATELSTQNLDCSVQVDFIASNFEHFRNDPNLGTLPFTVLKDILTSPNLKIGQNVKKNHHAEWLISFAERHNMQNQLVPIADFDSLSGKTLRAILALPKLNTNLLSSALKSVINNGISPNFGIQSQVVHCPYLVENPMDGIFAFASRFYGEPASRALGIVGSSQLHELVNPNFSGTITTAPMADSWVSFEFINASVKLNGYSIRGGDASYIGYLTSWVLEGSMDELDWFTLDQHNKNSSLQGVNKSFTWQVRNDREARFIRLRQTGKNAAGTDSMMLRSIEVYGSYTPHDGRSEKVCNFEVGKEFCGIFDHLQREFQQNPVYSDLLRITSSGDAKYIADGEWAGCWRSPDMLNPFIEFQFHAFAPAITMYRLETYEGKNHAKSWTVEGSNDGITWVPIDVRKDRTELCGKKRSFLFRCEVQSRPFSSIRIKMTDSGDMGQHVFWLSNVEFYGDVHILPQAMVNRPKRL